MRSSFKKIVFGSAMLSLIVVFLVWHDKRAEKEPAPIPIRVIDGITLQAIQGVSVRPICGDGTSTGTVLAWTDANGIARVIYHTTAPFLCVSVTMAGYKPAFITLYKSDPLVKLERIQKSDFSDIASKPKFDVNSATSFWTELRCS